ncbi:MAG TPA: NACHT domain-containing protein, partial [Ktedonobacteraceae bacterium]|nr:NACHT domain-containing protein [Ktedonobacteraceae bacterium]
MKDSLSSQETQLYNPLIRYFSLLWQQTGTIYSFLLLGIALMLGAIWTITGSQALQISNLFPFSYPLADFLFGASLLVITAIAWGVGRIHSNPSTIVDLHNADIQRNRRALINLLLLDYERRLTQSLQGVALDRLQLRDRSDIQPPDSPLILYPSEQEMGYFLPAGTSILEAYEQAGNRFLLVGNSGHGKTTHLLNLARELLIRAQNDQEQPIPIVINMASWATKDKPFSNWIDEQLLKYQLDSTRNQIMLTHTRWILLFDDFDAVDASEHAECIRAINAFRDRYMNAPIVVCSTSEALLSQAEVFNINSAIEIMPLQVQDILNYLTQIGEPAAAIAETFQANDAYQQLLSNPIMLD